MRLIKHSISPRIKVYPYFVGSAQIGFTIIELVTVSVLSTFLILVIARLATSHMRSSNSFETAVRAREEWGFLNKLIETDISEGSSVSVSSPTNSIVLPAVCNPGGSTSDILRIDVPQFVEKDVNVTTDDNFIDEESNQLRSIYYFASNNILYRCGNPVQLNGSLNTVAASFSAPVANEVQFTVVPGTLLLGTQLSRSVTYTIGFTGYGRSSNPYVYFSQSTRAHVRASNVVECNGTPDSSGILPCT